MQREVEQFFRFRHHYLMQAIDSEILCELLLAIDEKRRIQMRVDSAFRGSIQVPALPLKIYISTETGREYLLSGNEDPERFYFTRLDRIVWVKQMEVASSWDQMMELFHLQKNQLWGVSFGSLDKVYPPVHFEMEISVNESEEYIVRRLEREKRGGTVVRLRSGSSYLFSADIYDANELLPWICTFTGRILRIKCDNEDVINKYRDYLAQMAGFYQLSGEARADSDDTSEAETHSSDREIISQNTPTSEFRPLLKNGTISLKPSGDGSGSEFAV